MKSKQAMWVPLVIGVCLAFVWNCSDNSSPTSSDAPSSTQKAHGNTTGLATSTAVGEETANSNPNEEFNCTDIQEAQVRFSEPGWVRDNVVGLFVNYAGVPDKEATLRIWWDYDNHPEKHENIRLGDDDIRRSGDLLDIRKIIEHTYDVSSVTKFRVRVHLKLANQTGNCARVREVKVGSSPAPSSGPAACVPTGGRVAYNALLGDSASGCWSGNPCPRDAYAFNSAYGQNFQAFGENITCGGASGCVGNVGITTYSGNTTVCQGAWDVYCDAQLVGRLDTLGRSCAGTAMTNGCSISFAARICNSIRLVAVSDGNFTAGCCGGSQPDSMITAVSAW